MDDLNTLHSKSSCKLSLSDRFKLNNSNNEGMDIQMTPFTNKLTDIRKSVLENCSDEADLRLLISAKRQISKSFLRSNNSISKDFVISYSTEQEKDNDNNSDQTKETVASSLSVDVTPLKQLAPIDVGSDIWYIAADRDVLFKSHNFLKTLIHSDNNCCLMVPSNLMVDVLEFAYNKELKDLNQNAADMLLVLLKSKKANIVNTPAKITCKENAEIIDYCLELKRNNIHVVLLSNNPDFKEYGHLLPIFNIAEVIEFLASSGPAQKQINLSQISSKSCKNTPCNSAIESYGSTENLLEKPVDNFNPKEEYHYDNDALSLNAEVQTDAIIDTQQNYITNELQEINLSDKSTMKTGRNSKKFHLKRSSNTPINPNSTNCSHFKWRKKRVNDNLNSLRSDCSNVSETFDPCTNNKDDFAKTQREGTENSNSSFVEEQNSALQIDDANSNTKLPLDLEDSNRLQVNSKDIVLDISQPIIDYNLRNKRDEWISRFVQIMEEVLTQVLQQNVHTLDSNIPPPWSIHEATKCIETKYADTCVKIAAKSMHNDLTRNSDNKSKLRMDLSPMEFVKMFYSGLTLVLNLQTVEKDFDDLKSALENLLRLYEDIKDPNETSLDSFHEVINNPMDCKNGSVEQNNDQDSNFVHNSPSETQLENEKCSQEYNVDKVLQEKYVTKTKSVTNNENITKLTFLKNFELLNTKANEDVTKDENEPKILRHFTKCMEFEENLKRKYSSHDDPMLFEKSDNYAQQFLGKELNKANVDTLKFDSDKMQSLLHNELSHVKQIIGESLLCVKQYCAKVIFFCKSSMERIKEPDTSPEMKNEIANKVMVFRQYLSHFLEVLDRIYDPLPDEESCISVLDDTDANEYKTSLRKNIKIVEYLILSLNFIIYHC